MQVKDLTYEQLRNVLGDLPEIKLIEECREAIEKTVREAGEIMVRGILLGSAEQLTGPESPGKRKAQGRPTRHGTQKGTVYLGPSKLSVSRPRVRSGTGKGAAEVDVPAYETLRSDVDACKLVRKAVISGLSTRKYESAVMAGMDSCGVSKSSVSRRLVRQTASDLEDLTTRPLPKDLVVVFIDGIGLGSCVVTSVGIDSKGRKHALGLASGTTENSAVVGDLLKNLISRGLNIKSKLLFVIDGSKALEKAVIEICGDHHFVQRCRVHKKRNVLDRLPKEKRAYVKAAMNSAWKLPPESGIPKMKLLAQELRVSHPDAANSLLEGLERTFTVNSMDLSPLLKVSLATTNLVENPHGAIRNAVRRIGRFRKPEDALRWAASVLLEAEKTFRGIKGVKDLWMLEAALDRLEGEEAM